ncbi:hypothetical protein AVEN_83795-1 [Araneus ventricosus]|uniref:Uncharacterized protein n=1 Tax=Araneus ventricosus TaxID=182803 RepID=A0A4Y2U835_ARAVE|nr:hypothetical protein AVEN_83795-1 [Araneus ventricosus]
MQNKISFFSQNFLFDSLNPKRLFLLAPLKPGPSEWKQHELDSPNLGGHLPPHRFYKLPLRFARIIRPPTALISEAISEPHLLSKDANSLRAAFVAVKGKFLDRPGPPRSVSEG